jgi:hypothetical protein
MEVVRHILQQGDRGSLGASHLHPLLDQLRLKLYVHQHPLAVAAAQ